MPVYGLLEESQKNPALLRPTSVLADYYVKLNNNNQSNRRRTKSASNQPNTVLAAYGTQVHLHSCKTLVKGRKNEGFGRLLKVHLPITKTKLSVKAKNSNVATEDSHESTYRNNEADNNMTLTASTSHIDVYIRRRGISYTDSVDITAMTKRTQKSWKALRHGKYCATPANTASFCSEENSTDDSERMKTIIQANEAIGVKTREDQPPITVEKIWLDRHKITQKFAETRGSQFAEVDLRRSHTVRPQTSCEQRIKAHETPRFNIQSRQRSRSCVINNKRRPKMRKCVRQAWGGNGECVNDETPNPTGHFVDTKVLIQQNHRPTTSIKYVNTNQNITSVIPSVRKAVLSQGGLNSATESHVAKPTLPTQSPDIKITPTIWSQDVVPEQCCDVSVLESPDRVSMPSFSKEFQLARDQCLSDEFSKAMKTFSKEENAVEDHNANNYQALKMLLEQDPPTSSSQEIHNSNSNEDLSIHIPSGGHDEYHREMSVKNKMVRLWLKEVEENKEEMTNFTDEWKT